MEKILEIFFEIIFFLFFMCHILQFSVCFKVFWKSTIQISQSRHNFVLFRSFWKPPVFRFWHVGFRFQSVTYNSGSVRFRFASKRPVSVRFSVISVNRHITTLWVNMPMTPFFHACSSHSSWMFFDLNIILIWAQKLIWPSFV